MQRPFHSLAFKAILWLGLLGIVWTPGAQAMETDWPQLLGPHRNGAVAGEGPAENWPKEGPPILWQRKVGAGFSGPAVAGGRLILFHRQEGEERIECLDARTGKTNWTSGYSATYEDDFGFDDGPRAVPTIADGKVYALGADGILTCLSLEDGKKLWRVDCRDKFKASKGFFGVACSPLVEGNAVLLNIGGTTEESGIVAFDKETGKALWQATGDEASYSSPVAASINSQSLAFFFTRAGLVILDPANGRLRHRFPWRSRSHASVNAASPLIVEDTVFVSASYDTGAALLRVKRDRLETIWSGDDSLSNHYATSVHRNGFLFGLHGRHDFPGGTELRCVELATGKVRWSRPGLNGANVILAGSHLLLLTEQGELLRIPAVPDGFRVANRAQILPGGVRAHPALAGGLFYARSKDRLVCVDLRNQASSAAK